MALDHRLSNHWRVGPRPTFALVEQRDHVSDVPQLVGNARGHSGGNPQRAVDTHEVVIHEVQRDGMPVILDLLRERIR